MSSSERDDLVGVWPVHDAHQPGTRCSGRHEKFEKGCGKKGLTMMNRRNYRRNSLAGVLFWLALSWLGLASTPGQTQNAGPPPAMVKLGIVSVLTGPAAAPFGIPGRNGAEI